MKKKHIVVLGAGFGGLTLARKLKNANAEITIVDRQNHHLFQPLLYQAATAGLALPEISAPVRSIFAKRENINVLMETVVGIDLSTKQVHLKSQSLDYDYLVIALGMVNAYFGRNEWAQHTIGLKSLNEARRIRQSVLYSFEKAEITADPQERKRLMTIVIIGGGPSGVEMAGALAELTKKVFLKEFRSIRTSESRVVLIEASDRILGTYSKESSHRAQADLERIGVELHLGAPVQDIQHKTVQLKNETIEASTIIWTAGVEANPAVKELPVEHDRRGRVKVEPDTSLKGFPEAFAIGDIAALTDKNGVDVPGVSPGAIQMGQHVAKIIDNELSGKSQPGKNRPAFAYFDKGSMATIGRSSAIAEFGKMRFSGFSAWTLWLAVHLIFLIGFRNRLAVLLQWFYAYIKFRPGARVFENEEVTADLEAADLEAADKHNKPTNL